MVNKKNNAKPKKNRPRDQAALSNLRVSSTIIIALIFALGLYFISTIEIDSSKIKEPSSDKNIPTQEESLNHKKQAFTFYDKFKQNAVEIKKLNVNKNLSNDKQETVYLVQAGSFQTEEQAEQRLVELTLLGFEPDIHASVNVSGNRWHRVTVGPYTSRREVTAAQSILMANNLETMVREETR
tara:strand:+ start:1753 stop:2301 length:549 start_codon:yes stop_codon:yes gene_type:complete